MSARLAIVVSLLVGTACFAQEQKRPERMEGALGADEQTKPSASRETKLKLPGLMPDGSSVLHNQWSLAPAGSHIELGDFPVNLVLRPDGKIGAVLHCGHGTHEVVTVDLKSRQVLCRVSVPQAFYGICFSPDGRTIFASGAEYDLVHSWAVDAQGLLSDHRETRVVPAKESFVVTGLATSTDGSTLYTCGGWGDRLAILHIDGSHEAEFVAFPKDSYPYSATRSSDGTHLFVSLWGGSGVAVVNLGTKSVETVWSTPSHPTEMTPSPDGSLLYVACSNSNSVAVIDTQSGRTLEIIGSALFPTAPNGSTPNSLALSKDGQILLIANADNNNLAVINVSERGGAKPMGFIPVGWYPTSVRFDPQGNILVASGKGLSPRSNRHGPQPGVAAKNVREYIGGLHKGSLSFIKMPDAKELATHTAQAFACSPLRKGSAVVDKSREADNPIPAAVGGASPIKHCIYIIRENRTYDQVLGDMPEGNGDPTICLFGEQVTPNAHALAREFVLLDNFYVESEVSADGHEWTMGAYATDFVEKTWPLNYRKQPKNAEINYPAEGNHAIAVPAGGYLWDRCAKAGVSYFTFGEWIENGDTPEAPGRAKVPELEGKFDPKYRSYDINYSDLDRADRFIAELGRFEREDTLPGCIVMRLPNDHTAGTRVGALTPTAMVAQNDLALGRLIEAISKSKYWKDTAIFVVEDDAQNGSDHVDAHRTVAFVISSWTKRGYVDSSLYSTSSMLRSMELILGLEPMSQFDAAALPMYASFSHQADLTPYVCKPASTDLGAKNLASAWGAETSATLELAVEDAADDLVLNEIIWKSVRGGDSPVPPPVRAAFVFAEAEEPDADDD